MPDPGSAPARLLHRLILTALTVVILCTGWFSFKEEASFVY